MSKSQIETPRKSVVRQDKETYEKVAKSNRNTNKKKKRNKKKVIGSDPESEEVFNQNDSIVDSDKIKNREIQSSTLISKKNDKNIIDIDIGEGRDYYEDDEEEKENSNFEEIENSIKIAG